ncbi:Uncharacterised protein [uncultured archaeon]|nr:Uncharacterised protein [uncultured archaeon]
MKTIWCYVSLVLVFLTAGICAAEVPNLLGNWTGSWSAYETGWGYSESTGNDSINIAVVEQKDRIFIGNLVLKAKNESDYKDSFVGAIGLDNKTLYMAEVDEGYIQGTLISNDEMDMIYLADGKEASVVIDRVHRIKA